MSPSLEELGLSPDLSRLASWVQDLIRDGACGGLSSHSEVSVAVCAEMFHAGYGLDEVWIVMTDPAHAISEVFFEKDGEEAEAYLEKIIFMGHEVANWEKGSR